MADECCNSFGGLITIEIDGVMYDPTEADIVLDPSNIEVTEMANQNGSAAYTEKVKLFGAEITLRNSCGIKWNEVMRKCAVNATIVERNQNRSHLFTKSRIVGSPKVNLSSGEVLGLRIAGPQYQVI